jgi:hypothetical protein
MLDRPLGLLPALIVDLPALIVRLPALIVDLPALIVDGPALALSPFHSTHRTQNHTGEGVGAVSLRAALATAISNT